MRPSMTGRPGRPRSWRSVLAPGEQGVALILVVMMAFGIMGILAIGVDFGLAFLAQAQMQTAVDAAALEGLRMRDAYRDAPYAERDLYRRHAASTIASLVFDADGELFEDFGEGQDGDTLGTPVIEITPPHLIGNRPPGGLRKTTTGRSPQIEGVSVYKPQLQLNVDNEIHGDLVQGIYFDENNKREVPKEGKRYWREDFEPMSAIPESLNDPTADAFLVRMRRTNDFLGLDNIRGVSSSGPPLPLLFGHGGTIAAGDPSRGYSYRHHGITVRATAISQARPALSIGVPVQDEQFVRDKTLLGKAPFVLTDKFIRSFEGSGRVRIANGKVKIKTGLQQGAERKIGWFVPERIGLAVGDKVRERDLAPPSAGTLDVFGYVPIVDKFRGERGFPPDEAMTDWRVVGFALFLMRGTLEETPRGVGGKEIVLRQFRGQVIVSENASAVLMPTFAAPTMPGGQLGAKAVELLLKRNEKLAEAGLGILAPALVR